MDNLSKWKNWTFIINFLQQCIYIYIYIYIYLFKCKFDSKENYLNFVIEWHFNDHTLEKLNSNACCKWENLYG
jgi:hypothetical protein